MVRAKDVDGLASGSATIDGPMLEFSIPGKINFCGGELERNFGWLKDLRIPRSGTRRFIFF
jgi:hypothetical protein